MSLLTAILKTTFTNRIKELEALDGEATVTNTATAKLVTNQLNEGAVRGFALVQDEPQSVAGTATGPTPTDYFVQSVAFCENVVFARNAALSDLEILSLETRVVGQWDMKGLFDIGKATPAFQTIAVETRVRTTGPAEKAAEVARMTHRRCPIHATLQRATDLSFTLYVNDVETPL